MTTALKEIVGELSSLSEEKQKVAASVIHALWAEERTQAIVHSEWKAELERRNGQIESGAVELISEASMDAFLDDLAKAEA